MNLASKLLLLLPLLILLGCGASDKDYGIICNSHQIYESGERIKFHTEFYDGMPSGGDFPFIDKNGGFIGVRRNHNRIQKIPYDTTSKMIEILAINRKNKDTVYYQSLILNKTKPTKVYETCR